MVTVLSCWVQSAFFCQKNNRYNEISENIDHRTNGYKFRKESMMSKTDAAVLLIQRALQSGINADYLLMDTWFTTEPMIRSVLDTGLDVIGMVKQLKQRYTYKGKNIHFIGSKEWSALKVRKYFWLFSSYHQNRNSC